MSTILLIPIFEPSDKTIHFMKDLIDSVKTPIVIINDGSGQEYQPIFEKFICKKNVHFLSYSINKGKGFALRYGMKYIKNNFSKTTGFVTADSDGQHDKSDIVYALEQANNIKSNKIILGVRSFNKESTPFKSYYGNRLTSLLFQLITQIKIEDTQTGLRIFSYHEIENLLKIRGNRFEYEMNVLLNIKTFNWTLQIFPIKTIYEDNNVQTHFHPIKDSFRVYLPIFSFMFSSIFSALIDITSFSTLLLFLGKTNETIFFTAIISRIIAGVFNYYINKSFVFLSKESLKKTSIKYIVLFCTQILISSVSIFILSNILSSIIFVKIFVDLCLFIFSFQIQQRFVFSQ